MIAAFFGFIDSLAEILLGLQWLWDLIGALGLADVPLS